MNSQPTKPNDHEISHVPPPSPPNNGATLQQSESAETTSGSPLPPELAKAPHILDRFLEALRTCGVIGEDRAAQLIFLVMMSRFLNRLVSAVLKGPSSGGKSFVLATTLRFFPTKAYYELTGMSEKVLAYLEEPLSHRFLIIYEAAGIGGYATYLIRSLLSEGSIRYQTVEQVKGVWKPKVLIRPGPTGFLSSTTAIKLHPENETRLLSIPISDTPEQTRRVLECQADVSHSSIDLSEWLQLQLWLEQAEHGVEIPFAMQLAQAIPPVAVRLRRDFATLLGLIKAHAILHQLNRERDANGHILATLEDYAVVRNLTSDLLTEGVGLSVPVTVRETVAAVQTIIARKGGSQSATNMEVATELGLDKSAAWRRIKVALSLGYLSNDEHRHGKPFRLVMGDPLPEERVLLPRPEDLDRCTVADEKEKERGA